jgi:uncharacterized membrane protein
MKLFVRTFLRGLVAFLPLVVTGYGIYYLVLWLDRWSKALLHAFVPDAPDVPGLGIVVAALVIFGLGLIVSSRLTRRLYEVIEFPFRQLPVVKELYTMTKQLAEFLTPRDDVRASQVVRLRHPGSGVEMVGLLTRGNLDDLPEGIAGGDRVAVFLPMSYQLGGYTVFVPRAWVAPLDISVETAMRETLTGWLKEPRR